MVSAAERTRVMWPLLQVDRARCRTGSPYTRPPCFEKLGRNNTGVSALRGVREARMARTGLDTRSPDDLPAQPGPAPHRAPSPGLRLSQAVYDALASAALGVACTLPRTNAPSATTT